MYTSDPLITVLHNLKVIQHYTTTYSRYTFTITRYSRYTFTITMASVVELVFLSGSSLDSGYASQQRGDDYYLAPPLAAPYSEWELRHLTPSPMDNIFHSPVSLSFITPLVFLYHLNENTFTTIHVLMLDSDH